MALDRQQMGLLFKLDADSKDAKAGFTELKEFAIGVLEGIQAEIRAYAKRATDSMDDIGDHADKLDKKVGNAGKKGAEGFDSLGKKTKASAGIIRESVETISSEIIESFGIDGDIANTLANQMFNLNRSVLIIGGTFVGLTALVAGSAAAMFGLANHAADADGKIADLAAQTNLSAESLAAMKVSADEAGVSIEEVGGFVSKFQQSLLDANAGNKGLAASFKQLGIDTAAGLRDPQAAFDQFLKKINQVADGAAKADLVEKLGGAGGVKLLQFLKDGENGLDSFKQKALDLGIALPDAFDTARADEFNDTLTNIGDQLSGLLTTVGRELIPVIQPFLDLLSAKLAEAGKNAESFGKDLASGTQNALDVGGDLLTLLDTIFTGVVDLLRIIDDGSDGAADSIADVEDGLGGLRSLIYFVAGGFAVISDSARLMADLVLGVIKQISLSALEAINGVLDFFGLASDTMKGEITRLRSDLQNLEKDFNRGYALTNKVREAETQAGNRNDPLKRLSDDGFASVGNQPPKTTIKPTLKGSRTKASDPEAQDQLARIKIREQAAQREADAEIFEAKRAFEFRQITIEQLTSQIIEAEKKKQIAQEATFAQERKLVNESKLRATEKEKKLAEIEEREKAASQRTNQAIEQAQDQRTKIEAAIFEQAAKARGDRQEAELRQQIARINAAADQRIVTEEAAERGINEIEEQIFQQRRIRLIAERTLAAEGSLEKQRAADELAKLEQERATQVEQAQLRILEAQRRDLANLRAYLQERNRILESLRREEIEGLQLAAEEAERKAARRPNDIIAQQAAIQARRNALIAELEFQHQLALIRIEADRKEAVDKAQSREQIEAIEKASNERRLQEEQNFQNKKQGVNTNSREQSLAADPSSPLSIFGSAGQEAADRGAGLFGQMAATAQDALGSVGASLGNMQSIAEGAFGSIASGLGSMIESFILTGQTGPAAFKKLAAGVIASITAQSAVKAIFEVAQGLAAAASFPVPDPDGARKAALHFAAAKTFGLIAGVGAASALAIGAIGGGDSAANGGRGNADAGSRSNEKRTIEQGGPLRDDRPIIINLHGELRDGVLQVVEQDYQSNGRMRQMVRRDVLEG